MPPRAEGSKPLRVSKAYQRATEFLASVDEILTPLPQPKER